MTFIRTISYQDSDGKLRKLYDRVRGPGGQVDRILQSHSLRPASLEGHMTLYKNVLHHNELKIERWFRETIGLYVSLMNRCSYCVSHHYAGLASILNDPDRATNIRKALEAGSPEQLFKGKHLAMLRYVEILTVRPSEVTVDTAQNLRQEGWSDGEILEANQVAAYFAYANRTVLGLGVETSGEILGTAPSDANHPEDWRHK